MDVGGNLSVKKFVVSLVVSIFLFIILLTITPPYIKDTSISYYNPEKQAMDYNTKWNNWFWLGFFIYAVIVAYIGALVGLAQKKDLVQLWHDIPDIYRQKFGLPNINNIDFAKDSISKEYGTDWLEAIVTKNDKKRVYMRLKTDAPPGENPIKTIITFNWALSEYKNFTRESASVLEMVEKLGDKLSKDQTGMVSDVLKRKLNQTGEQEEIE